MVYMMKFSVDGGCRGYGHTARGVAVAVLEKRYGGHMWWSSKLSTYPVRPTSQRAELRAILLAQNEAWNRYLELDNDPFLKIYIKSDSRYAVNCMNEWLEKWQSN